MNVCLAQWKGRGGILAFVARRRSLYRARSKFRSCQRKPLGLGNTQSVTIPRRLRLISQVADSARDGRVVTSSRVAVPADHE